MFQAVANRFHGIAIQFQAAVHSHVVDLAHSSSSFREVDLISRERDLSASRKMEVTTAASVVPKPAACPHPLSSRHRRRVRVPSLDVTPVPVAVPVAVPEWVVAYFFATNGFIPYQNSILN